MKAKKKPYNFKWSDETLLAEAKRYTQRQHWIEGSPSSYLLSCQRGRDFHAKACAHMVYHEKFKNPPPKPHGYWTRERVIEEANKYLTSGAWRKGCMPSYLTAYKNGWQTLTKFHKPLSNYYSPANIKHMLRRSTRFKTLPQWIKLKSRTVVQAQPVIYADHDLLVWVHAYFEYRGQQV